jgi:hypothetical protein
MKKEARYKNYRILIEDDNSVKVLSSNESLTPVKSELRKLAEDINWKYDEEWNTQTLGSKLVDYLHKMSECKMNKGQAIVVNRMYVGNYLSSNLGHEVINMYTADNGNHYLYLNAYGSFAKKWQGKIGYMLLVKYHDKNCVEVLGKAEGLYDVYNYEDGSNNSNATEISSHQFNFIEREKITYGKVLLTELFSNEERQSVYITFKADKIFKLKEKKSILIYYKPQEIEAKNEGNKPDENQQKTNELNVEEKIEIYLENNKLALASLDQFFEEDNGDYEKLKELITSYEDYWVELGENDKISLQSGYKPKNKSIFDICELQNNENCFSYALAYFMREYPKLWNEFFRYGECRKYENLSSLEKINIDLKTPFSVVREQNTKIKNSNSGRIDLFISNDEHIIVIENKIKSDINKVGTDLGNSSQLDRYVKYVENLKKNRTPHYFILTPNYNIPEIGDEEMKKAYRVITYKDLYEFLANKDEVKEDVNFRSFFNAMHRHTHENVNDYLYNEMQEKLMHRIYEYRERNPQS